MIVEGIDVKIIPGFLNYAITKDGKVWSMARQRLFNVNNPKKLRFYSGRWLVPCRDPDGYLGVTLCKNHIKYSRKIHQLVLETYVSLKLEGQVCRHLNGTPADNRLDNLCWGTPSENQLDRNKHGTGSRGELNPSVKLIEQDIHIIRYLRKVAKFTLADLAWQFNVHISTICGICKRRTWKHLWAAT